MVDINSNLYTHFYQKGEYLYLRGYANGARVEDKILISPYLFRTAKKDSLTPYRTIFDDKVDRVDFENIYDAKQWVKDNKDIFGQKIYGSDSFDYIEIYERYKDSLKYKISDPSVVFCDIENAIPAGGGFPAPKKAQEQITCITLGKNNKYYHLSMTELDLNDEDISNLDVEHLWFINESELLRGFLKLWAELDPDIVTGWNVSSYDMVYLYNRIRNVLGKSFADRLSPWKDVKERTYEAFGKEQVEYTFQGISVLDYLDLYKKFSFTPRETYRLDFISQEEVGIGKLDYSEYKDFNDFYERNPQKYSCYNIIDVLRVVQIDKKRKLIDLAISMAFDAKINFNDVFGVVQPWDCKITNYLQDRQIVVPWKNYAGDPVIMGGYVKEVQQGKWPWVVSFDAASLYPHIIMLLNLGPDTIVDHLPNINPDSILEDRISEILQDCKDRNLSISGIGSRFRRDRTGFLSELMEELYSNRSLFKKQMKEAEDKLEHHQGSAAEKRELEDLISMLNSKQMAIKIFANALFGSLANAGSRYCSASLSEGITSTGQTGIRWAERHINEYLNKVLGTKDFDFVVAIDTDSLYINLYPLVEKYGKQDLPWQEITKFCKEICDKALSPYIQKKMLEFGNMLNAHKPDKLYFKLEKISLANIHCLHPKSTINGTNETIADLFSRGIELNDDIRYIQGLEAPSINEAGEVYQNSVELVIRRKFSGDMYKLILEDGREIEVTDTHPVLVNRNGKHEWVLANRLQIDDDIVTL